MCNVRVTGPVSAAHAGSRVAASRVAAIRRRRGVDIMIKTAPSLTERMVVGVHVRANVGAKPSRGLVAVGDDVL